MPDGALIFVQGEYGEGYPWRIEFKHDARVDGRDHRICKHCGPVFSRDNSRFDGGIYQTTHAIVPRVVVALNEGGDNITAVCLDCILEAASGLQEK